MHLLSIGIIHIYFSYLLLQTCDVQFFSIFNNINEIAVKQTVLRVNVYYIACQINSPNVLGVVDPYERKWLELAKSGVPESGRGVFALRDIPANRTIALYSLFLYKGGEQVSML